MVPKEDTGGPPVSPFQTTVWHYGDSGHGVQGEGGTSGSRQPEHRRKSYEEEEGEVEEEDRR